jgi:hypothetical protein
VMTKEPATSNLQFSSFMKLRFFVYCYLPPNLAVIPDTCHHVLKLGEKKFDECLRPSVITVTMNITLQYTAEFPFVDPPQIKSVLHQSSGLGS